MGSPYKQLAVVFSLKPPTHQDYVLARYSLLFPLLSLPSEFERQGKNWMNGKNSLNSILG